MITPSKKRKQEDKETPMSKKSKEYPYGDKGRRINKEEVNVNACQVPTCEPATNESNQKSKFKFWETLNTTNKNKNKKGNQILNSLGVSQGPKVKYVKFINREKGGKIGEDLRGKTQRDSELTDIIGDQKKGPREWIIQNNLNC